MITSKTHLYTNRELFILLVICSLFSYSSADIWYTVLPQIKPSNLFYSISTLLASSIAGMFWIRIHEYTFTVEEIINDAR